MMYKQEDAGVENLLSIDGDKGRWQSVFLPLNSSIRHLFI